MLIICNPYCHDVAPSSAMLALEQAFSARYGSENVVIDSSAVSAERFLADDSVFLVVCDHTAKQRQALVQLPTEELARRLVGAGVELPDVAAAQLRAWLREQAILTRLNLFDWSSCSLETALDKVRAASWQPTAVEVVLLALLQESFAQRERLASPLLRFKASLLFPQSHGQARSALPPCVHLLVDGDPEAVKPAIFQPHPHSDISEALGTRLLDRLPAAMGHTEITLHQALLRYLVLHWLFRVEMGEQSRVSRVGPHTVTLAPSPEVTLEVERAKQLFCYADGVYSRRRYFYDSSDDWHAAVHCGRATEEHELCDAGTWWAALDNALRKLRSNL